MKLCCEEQKHAWMPWKIALAHDSAKTLIAAFVRICDCASLKYTRDTHNQAKDSMERDSIHRNDVPVSCPSPISRTRPRAK